LKTTLVAARLERTREVLHELLRSVRQALPILMGVAGPIFVASLALLALAGVPPMLAVTLAPGRGAALWLAQALAAAWPLWALRGRLLPEAWCVQLRCLPFGRGALWSSDLIVSAALLAPLGGLYVLSAIAFAVHGPAWFVAARPQALVSLASSWLASCALGAAALAWQRRGAVARARRRAAAPVPEALLAARPGVGHALLWSPWWRGATNPTGRSVVLGLVSASLIAAAWTRGAWPAMPGAAWALAFCALLVALTERVQRALETHLAPLEGWLVALPIGRGWRWQARALACLPMIAGGAVAVGLVLASRPWRGAPLVAFAVALVAVPAAMVSVPAENREAHVGLWAVSVGVLTALGSELWI
jgi:hypothetical protein